MNALNRINKTEVEMINKYGSMITSGLTKMANSYFDWKSYGKEEEE